MDHDKFKSTVEATYMTWDAERQVYDRMDVLQKELCRKIGEMIVERCAKECLRNIPPKVLANMRHEPNAQIDQRSAFEMGERIRASFAEHAKGGA